MAMQAQRTQLSNGRWHLQHGPIDIVLGASGTASVVEMAHAQAWQRFAGILDELAQELAALRRPVRGACPVRGTVAQRMWQACEPYKNSFITPMAAVAGAVAQELIACYARSGVTRAWINNGGDIALHLAPGQSLRIGLYADIARLSPQEIEHGVVLDGQFEVTSQLPVRGVATSGWRGRSFSLGIADSVTVLAHTAAQADAAATVIANAVDVADPRIVRRSACEIKDDTDLGSRLVTVGVPPLASDRVDAALRAGLKRAHELRAVGLIWSAALVCQDQVVTTDAATLGTLKRSSPDQQLGPVFA